MTEPAPPPTPVAGATATLSDILNSKGAEHQRQQTELADEDGADALQGEGADSSRVCDDGGRDSPPVCHDDDAGQVASAGPAGVARNMGDDNDAGQMASAGTAGEMQNAVEDDENDAESSARMLAALDIADNDEHGAAETQAKETIAESSLHWRHTDANADSICSDIEEFEKQMACFEKDYASAVSAANAWDSPPSIQHEASHCEQNSVHCAYSELYNAVPMDMVMRMKIAMEDIPEDVPGLQDCASYLSQKQHYTLLDMLVTQYILNQGILMRQAHGTEDEYHIDMGMGLDWRATRQAGNVHAHHDEKDGGGIY